MSPDERQLLKSFLADLEAIRVAEKDEEAARLIEATIRANRDAAYALVQHAMLSNQAIAAAEARIAELERQAAPRGGFAKSFLGGASPLGRGRGVWGNRPDDGTPSARPSAAAAPGSAPGGGGFLRSVAATAAGVVGGQFLFAGLSNLLGGDRGPWGGAAEAAPLPPGEPVTINDYFADSAAPPEATPNDAAPDFGGGDFGGDGGGDGGGGGD